jgi:hypothetical protein
MTQSFFEHFLASFVSSIATRWVACGLDDNHFWGAKKGLYKQSEIGYLNERF